MWWQRSAIIKSSNSPKYWCNFRLFWFFSLFYTFAFAIFLYFSNGLKQTRSRNKVLSTKHTKSYENWAACWSTKIAILMGRYLWEFAVERLCLSFTKIRCGFLMNGTKKNQRKQLKDSHGWRQKNRQFPAAAEKLTETVPRWQKKNEPQNFCTEVSVDLATR